MKNLFYFGILGFILFEIANVYFIMPMPGSQEMNSLDAAYFLHSHRWWFRGACLLLALPGVRAVFSAPATWKKGLTGALLLAAGGVFYMAHFKMAADTMFYQPGQVLMKDAATNAVDSDRLVIGVEQNGAAKAYPIQFLGYHHQVRDSVGGRPVMVTYCTVCRTGRVFEPTVGGVAEDFRLVGMDHFNAMFEDARTRSWWRQATGEAVAGKLKGQFLPELPATQTTLGKWLALHPESQIMQPDPKFQTEYDSMATYEGGRLRGKLTVYDSSSWQKKSWVAGIQTGGANKAWDWNELKRQRVLNDAVGGQPVVVVLADDGKSLFAFRRAAAGQVFTLQNDTLSDGQARFDLLGRCVAGGAADLSRLNVYQEYWHSWQAFHPN